MKRLVFDTSTEWVVCGVLGEAGWIATIEKAEAQSQSKQLFEVLQEILDYHQISKKEITEIAVGVGPGSYTGLRIGVTVAKIWAFSAKLALFRFSSGRLMAMTQNEMPDADHPNLKLLRAEDFERVSEINEIVPVYSNDHFS